MIHLYHGDGKGKTTASVGLSVRAAGNGKKVLFVQFFKDGTSSEIKALSKIDGIKTLYESHHFGFYKTLNDEQKEKAASSYQALLDEAIAEAADYDLVVLDEIVSTYGHNMVNKETLLSFLKKEGDNREIVLTGRNPAPELVELADYVTEMKKHKHPFDKGVAAREGIEY